MQQIDLQTPLSFKSSCIFPLQNKHARREVVIGGILLLIPGIGWLLNMGHRIAMTNKMLHGQDAWPSWNNYRQLFMDGLLTFLGMVMYHLPAIIVGIFAYQMDWLTGYSVAVTLWIPATLMVPGYMTHYCLDRDPTEIFHPGKATRRVLQAGAAYWHAWLVALSGLIISLLGLIGFGIGFFFTSVWFWQVAGFSFASTFAQSFQLQNIATPSQENRSP